MLIKDKPEPEEKEEPKEVDRVVKLKHPIQIIKITTSEVTISCPTIESMEKYDVVLGDEEWALSLKGFSSMCKASLIGYDDSIINNISAPDMVEIATRAWGFF